MLSGLDVNTNFWAPNFFASASFRRRCAEHGYFSTKGHTEFNRHVAKASQP